MHARVGGVQPLNLEANIGDGFIWSIQLVTVTVEAVRHTPDTVEARQGKYCKRKLSLASTRLSLHHNCYLSSIIYISSNQVEHSL